MNKIDTQIITFKDNNDSIFTLKQGKSYNMSKYNKLSYVGKKKYCFVIVNCVSTDKFMLEYSDPTLRNKEYENFMNIYLSFNGMK